MRRSKLLYVEDDAEHRELYAAFLGASGYRVTTASSASEAAEALGKDDFDLVLAAVSLPDLDGRQVAAAARARRPRPCIVLLTGWNQEVPAIAALADEVLAKPVTPLDLLQRLSSLSPAS